MKRICNVRECRLMFKFHYTPVGILRYYKDYLEVTFYYWRWSRRFYVIMDIKLQTKNANTFNDKRLYFLGIISLNRSHNQLLNGHLRGPHWFWRNDHSTRRFFLKKKHVYKCKGAAIMQYTFHLNIMHFSDCAQLY